MSWVADIHKKKGKRQEFDVYIGRAVGGTEFRTDSKWGNPYSVRKFGLEKALKLYEKHIKLQLKKLPNYYNLEELRGKILGCWCITTASVYPTKCHGQVLMKLLRENARDNRSRV